jgi:indole-3-glycerol phosphate synthase
MGLGFASGVVSVLERLVFESEAETRARRGAVSQGELERIAEQKPPPRDFAGALRAPGLSVIAEMKARSPSAGMLCPEYDPKVLAAAFAGGGASALSVLVQTESFGGRPEHLWEAHCAADLPVLRKDFVTDEYQVVEARAYGADAVLLIVAALGGDRLGALVELIRAHGMEPLVEVHAPDEVDVALETGASVIGVNHRDLRTLRVDPTLTDRLRAAIPRDRVLVAESGIATVEDARHLREAGADAVLVGEALLRARDPAQLIRRIAVA